MDPTSLAAAAVTAVVPYLVDAGKGLAGKAGEDAWEQGKKLWTLLRQKLSGTAQSGALDDLSAQPGDDDLQAVARVQLRKALAADEAFAQALAALLPVVQSDTRQAMQVTGDNNTSLQAVGSTVTIGSK